MMQNITKRKKEYLREEKVVFDKLYQLAEFECFREQAKSYFVNKYNVDYMSMSIIGRNRDMVFTRVDHVKYHEYLADTTGEWLHYPLVLDYVFTIKPNEIYFEYFDTWMKTEFAQIRAEIFGERKYGGCEITISNEQNDMIIYNITFKHDKSLGTLPKEVLNELIKDLIRYRNLFTPFVRYGELGGDFSDKLLLNKYLDEFKLDNRSLFHIK